MTRMPNRVWSRLLAPLRLVLALLILFEEWGWEPLKALMARLARLPVLRQIDAAIRRLPPYGALVLFFLPGLLLLPVKLAAVWLVAHGQRLLGLGIILLSNLAVTAVVAHLFEQTRPALMQLGWFARLYERWSAWKAGLLDWVRDSTTWQLAMAWKASLRRWAQRLFGTGSNST